MQGRFQERHGRFEGRWDKAATERPPNDEKVIEETHDDKKMLIMIS